MSCPQAMQLVSDIEDEMSWGNVLKRAAARGLPKASFPQFYPSNFTGNQNDDEAVAQANVAVIRSLAEYLSAGDTDAVAGAVTTLTNARDQLFEGEPRGFDAASQDVQNWTGTTKTAFTTYLDNTKTSYRFGQDCLNDFAILYGMYQDLVTKCHNDLVAILQAGVNAFQYLDAQLLPVTLNTAEAVLAPLTSGGQAVGELTIVSLVTITNATQLLTQNVQIDTTTDQLTTQSIVSALNNLKENTNTHIQQLQTTLADLGNKIHPVTVNVQSDVPQFAQPGKAFQPQNLQPDSEPSNIGPVSSAPLNPGLMGGKINAIAQALAGKPTSKQIIPVTSVPVKSGGGHARVD